MLFTITSAGAPACIALANLYLLPEFVILVGLSLLLMFFVANFVVLGIVCQTVGRSILDFLQKKRTGSLPKSELHYGRRRFSPKHTEQDSFSFGVDRMGSTFVHGIRIQTTDRFARPL